jgi:AcrR family transcriptional regulator
VLLADGPAMMTSTTIPVSTKEQILLAAERLFAERGYDVSLREIGVSAGSSNNSAVQYHFGSKEQLAVAMITASAISTSGVSSGRADAVE